MTTIYIDESGHSGDMVHTGKGYDFKGQPYFALAGVGLENGHDWEARLVELRSRYRIQAEELKSSALTEKPKFSAEVLNTLLDQQVPLFIEVVDKRYYICTCITSFQLLPPCLGYPESVGLHFIRNTVADFLYFQASDRTLNAFVASCLAPSEETLLASFAGLRDMVAQPQEGDGVHIAEGVAHMVKESEEMYRELRDMHEEPWQQFLPPPDLNRRAKKVWMQPHLSSFTSIYARMNRYFGRRLSGIRLVHDQQFEVEPVLLLGKATVEGLDLAMGLPYTPQSDYRFQEEAPLEFALSHKAVGVQLADVVAGATMRIFRDLDAGVSVAPELHEVYMRLISACDERTGYGLNQVVPQAKILSTGRGPQASDLETFWGMR